MGWGMGFVLPDGCFGVVGGVFSTSCSCILYIFVIQYELCHEFYLRAFAK